MNLGHLFGAAAFVAVLAGSSAAQAQSLRGISIGEPATEALKSMPVSVPRDRQGNYIAQRWTQPDGNDLAVTIDARTNKVVYVEVDWSGSAKASRVGVGEMEFGLTNLGDVRKLFGNNGFAYRSMSFLPGEDGSSAMTNSFEIDRAGGVVFTVVTKISDERRREAARAKGRIEPVDIPQLARVDAVILASPDYLNQIWKPARNYDPAYKPVSWPKDSVSQGAAQSPP